MPGVDDFFYSKDGQNFYPLPTDETHETLTEKGYKPYVFLTRDGKPENYYHVPADDNLAKEFASGAKTPNEWNFLHSEDDYKAAKLPDQLDAFGIGIGRGFTSDGLDEGVAYAQSKGAELFGQPGNYEKRRNALRKGIHEAENVWPNTTKAGQFIGGIGQGLALSAVPGVGAAMKAAPVLSGAVAGGLQGYGASEAEDLPGQALDIATGGVVGAGLAKAVPPVVDKVIKPVAKGAARVLFGVPKWLSEAYYADPAKFKNLPEPETVWKEAGDIVRQADDNLASAKYNSANAKDALAAEREAIGSHYDTLRDEAKGAYATATDDFKVARARAEAKAGEARDALKTASVDAIDALRNVQPTVQMAKDIVARHAMQRQITNEMSQAANEALDQSGLTLDKPTIMELYDTAIDGLKVPGTDVHASDKAVAAAKSLMSQRDRLAMLPEELSAVQSRKLMQDLRTDIDFGSRSLEYNAALDNARMKVTEGISGILKEHGGKYADDMADLAARMRMLKDADKYFGDEQRAMGSLMAIAARNPKAVPAEETLRQYLGQDLQQLQKQLSLAQRAKEVLTSNAERRALTAGLPEQTAFQAAEKEALRYDPIKLKEAEQAAIAAWKQSGNKYGPETMGAALRKVIAEGPPEYQAMKEAERQLGQFAPLKLKQLKAKALMESDAYRAMQDAQDLLMWHKEIKGSISDISENGIESLLAASARNKRTLTPKDKLIRLQQAGDEMGMPTRDYIDWAKTNAGNEIFEGGYQNGSANVNLFSLLGAAFGGGAAGGGGGVPWLQAAFGAGMGRSVDAFGPRMGRGLIDASRSAAQSPTMQGIGRNVTRGAVNAMDVAPSEFVRQQIDRKYREQLRKSD